MNVALNHNNIAWSGIVHSRRVSVASLALTSCVCSGQRVAVVDLSIHKLDAHMPHVHCSRTIAKLLSDLDIPPFIVRTQYSVTQLTFSTAGKMIWSGWTDRLLKWLNIYTVRALTVSFSAELCFIEQSVKIQRYV